MKLKKRISIGLFLLLSFSTLFVLAEDIWETSLTITSGPSFSGPQGVVFTKYTDENGAVTWSPYNPSPMSITLDASLEGGGDAKAVITSASIADTSWSQSKSSTSRIGDKKISSWEEDFGSTQCVHSATVSTDAGYYTWSASGYVETTTWELERTVELAGSRPLGVSGGYTTSWVILAVDQTPVADGSSGSWRIEEKYKCSQCDFETTNASELSQHSCSESSESVNLGYCYRCYTGNVDLNSEDHKERTCTRKAWAWRKDWLTRLWYPVRVTCGQTFSWCNNPNTCFGSKAHKE